MCFAIFSAEMVNFITTPTIAPRHCIGWFSDQRAANRKDSVKSGDSVFPFRVNISSVRLVRNN